MSYEKSKSWCEVDGGRLGLIGDKMTEDIFMLLKGPTSERVWMGSRQVILYNPRNLTPYNYRKVII